MLNSEQEDQDLSVSGNAAKPHVLSSGIVEICFKSPTGSTYVHYRREVGTEDAKCLMAQVDEQQAKYGDKSPYFYRIA